MNHFSAEANLVRHWLSTVVVLGLAFGMFVSGPAAARQTFRGEARNTRVNGWVEAGPADA